MAHSRVKRRLGRLLEEARDSAGKTRDDVDQAPGLPSRATLQRLEGGIAKVNIGVVLALCRFYGVGSSLTDRMVELAEMAGISEQLDGFADISQQLGWYIDFEQDVSSLRSYTPGLIPGLLQTTEYALSLQRLATELNDEVIANRVAVRLKRQRILQEEARVSFCFVMDETALRMEVGSPDIMTQQLLTLKDLAPRIPIWVRPFKIGPHRDADLGGFAILEFPDSGEDPPMILTENLSGIRLREDPEVVESFSERFAKLLAGAVPIKEFMV